MGPGNLGDLGNLDLGQLQGYLQGVNFPAGKEEVASNAEGNNAPRSWSSRYGTREPRTSTAPTRSCRRCRAASRRGRREPARGPRAGA